VGPDSRGDCIGAALYHGGPPHQADAAAGTLARDVTR
jgi:hypothetical protein